MGEENAVDCPSVSELLPFLLNGTLAREEDDRVRAHLAACARCRRDLAGARQAMSVYSAHVPGPALIDLAWGREVKDLDAALLWQHIGSCEDCTSDLAQLKESRSLELGPIAFRPRTLPSRRAFLRYGAIAASLIAAFGAGMAYQLRGGALQSAPLEEERRRLTSRVGELESAIERLGEERSTLSVRVDELSAPKANVQVLELLPNDSTLRGTKRAVNEVRLRPDSELVVLLLTTQTQRPASIEVRSARGETVWRGEGVKPALPGGYSLGMPARLLTDSDYAILVRSQGGVETFPLHVTRVP